MAPTIGQYFGTYKNLLTFLGACVTVSSIALSVLAAAFGYLDARNLP